MALKLDEIRVLADRVARSHGLDVVDVEYQGGGGKHRTLRVFIEKNEAERAKLRERVEQLQARRESGDAEIDEDEAAFLDGLPGVANLEFLSGITHEDCEVFSQDFGTVLEIEELAPGTEYLLEISSPGLDRRLTGADDYRRFTGSLVKLQTFEPVAGNRHWQGRIAALQGESVVVDAGSGQERKKPKRGAAATPPVRVEIALGNIEKAHLVAEF
jgi:ribosome maturation factor RimP